jgi:hypothetical protein
VTAVKTVYNSIETTLATGAYVFDKTAECVELKSIASADQLLVNFTAGFGDASAVPPSIRQGMLRLMSHLYEHREDEEIPSGVEKLWQPYRERQL